MEIIPGNGAIKHITNEALAAMVTAYGLAVRATHAASGPLHVHHYPYQAKDMVEALGIDPADVAPGALAAPPQPSVRK
jgi:hypothetical protein